MLTDGKLEQGTRVPLDVTQPRRVSATRSSAKNRGRLDTAAEIVESCVGGANKSRVMLVANINSIVAGEMLGKLVASGLILAREEGISLVYSTTREGLDFVSRYSNLVSMLCPGLVPRTRLNDFNRLGPDWT